jgi:hypothetical protein
MVARCCLSDHEANAGTQKQKQEPAGLQEKQKVVSIQTCDHTSTSEKSYGAGPGKTAGTALSSVVRSFSLTRVIDGLQELR